MVMVSWRYRGESAWATLCAKGCIRLGAGKKDSYHSFSLWRVLRYDVNPCMIRAGDTITWRGGSLAVSQQPLGSLRASFLIIIGILPSTGL